MTQQEINDLVFLKSVTKMTYVSVYEQQKRVAEFNINLVTKPMSSISIYMVPFNDPTTVRKYIDHGINNALELFHTDIKELSGFLNTKELDEILALSDQIYEMIKINIVDCQ